MRMSLLNMEPTGCIFCEIVAGRAPAAVVWEGPEFVAFLDHQPIQPGHLLLVPREHIDYLFDLQTPRYRSLWDCARSLAGPLQQATGADRIGVAVEGYGVPHLHVHLVPLFSMGDLDPCKQHPVARDELNRLAAEIRSALGRIDSPHAG
jgi:histidine triad (HIT) family protein